MQLNKAIQQFRLLDLKSLMEYYAACNGYTVSADAAFGYKQCKELNSDRAHFLCALFTLLQRMTLDQLAGCLGIPVGAELNSVEQFLSVFTYNSFSVLLADQGMKEAICKFPHIDSVLSEKDYDDLYDTLFCDKRKYILWMREISGSLLSNIIHLAESGRSVLSLYASIPQIKVGLWNRAIKRDIYRCLQDEATALLLQTDFELYCATSISFDELTNAETVVEKYLGFQMQFFLPYWFSKITSEVQNPKILVKGKDSKYMYISDNLKLKEQGNLEELDLYTRFNSIMLLDERLFKKKKRNSDNEQAPFYNLADFVISLKASAKCLALNRELAGVSTCKFEFTLTDTLGAGNSAAFADSDFSFKNKIKNYMNQLKCVYDKSQDLNINNYKDVFLKISKNYTDKVNVDKQDSDKPLVDYSDVYQGDCSNEVFMQDSAYKVYGDLLNAIENLMRVDSILMAKKLSLAYVWGRAVDNMEVYSASIFLNFSKTNLSALNLYTDGYAVPNVSTTITEATLSSVYKTLSQDRGSSHINKMQLHKAQLSNIFDPLVGSQNAKVLVASCSTVLTRMILPLMSLQVDQGDAKNILHLTFGLLKEPHLTGEINDIERRYNILHNELPACDGNLDFNTFCLHFAYLLFSRMKDVYTPQEFYDILQNIFRALTNLISDIFPVKAGEVMSLIHNNDNALSTHTPSCAFESREEDEYQSVVCDFYRSYFTFCNSEEEFATYLLSPDWNDYESTSLHLVVIRVYCIAYMILDIVKSSAEQIHFDNMDTILNGRHVWEDTSLCIDLFIMVLQMCDCVQAKILEVAKALKKHIMKLNDLQVLSIENDDSRYFDTMYTIFMNPLDVRSISSSRFTDRYTIEQAKVLLDLSSCYDHIKNNIVVPLEKISNLVMSSLPEGESRIERFVKQFRAKMCGSSLVVSYSEAMNADYGIVVEHVACGALKMFLSESLILQRLSLIEKLKQFESYFSSYISDESGISACHKIDYSAKDRQPRDYAFVKKVLVDALSQDDFVTACLVRTNLDPKYTARFDAFRSSLIEDSETHFLTRDCREYFTICCSDEENNSIIYYLHTSGVFVGYVADPAKPWYSFLTFEAACNADLVEGYK